MFQVSPVDTFNYMVFGFAVILGAIGLFIASLTVRFHNLGKDLEVLAEIEAKRPPISADQR